MIPETRCLVRLSGALATRDDSAIRAALSEAITHCESKAIEEILLQAFLFLGFPATLNALSLWHDTTGGPTAEQGQTSDEGDPLSWATRGEIVCRKVYGSQYRALRRRVRSLHPDLDRWMIVDGYGKVLSRPGLTLEVRELAIVGLLVVLDVPVQLYSHLRGARAVGNSDGDIQAVLDSVADLTTPSRADRARSVWRRVQARS